MPIAPECGSISTSGTLVDELVAASRSLSTWPAYRAMPRWSFDSLDRVRGSRARPTPSRSARKFQCSGRRVQSMRAEPHRLLVDRRDGRRLGVPTLPLDGGLARRASPRAPRSASRTSRSRCRSFLPCCVRWPMKLPSIMSGDIATISSSERVAGDENIASPSMIGATIIGHGKSRGSASVGIDRMRGAPCPGSAPRRAGDRLNMSAPPRSSTGSAAASVPATMRDARPRCRRW